MKSRFRMLLAAITFSGALALLFAALALPGRLAAQHNQGNNQDHNRRHHHYRLIDMSTFGGPESAINGTGDNNDTSVNKRGVTVGYSATSSSKLPHSHPRICGGDNGYGSFITHAFRWKEGTVTDLGALPPEETDCSNAYQVNADGEVAGFSENGEFDPLLGFNQSRAVRWKDGEIEDLGSFGGNQNEALSINDRGQIVGFSTNTIPDPFSPNGTQTRAYVWQNEQMQDLGTLGTGNDALAGYINKHGQIGGFSYTSTIPNPVTGLPPLDPFLWENGKMVDLGTLGGAWGFPLFLNNRGQVVGVSSVAANPGACFTEFDPNCHPFLWSQGRLIDLKTSTIGGNPVSAAGINDAGEIVGAADFSSTGGSTFDAYLWRNGVATDLGTLDGDCFSGGDTAINSRGQVVSEAFSCDANFHHAFLWENGSIIDLNSLIPADSPLQLVLIADINDRGEIAGIGVPPGVPPANIFTEGHAFLLIPCDENHAGVEGCDYSLVEAPAAVPQPIPAIRDAASRTLTQSLLRRLSRMSRFRFPGRAFGPKN